MAQSADELLRSLHMKVGEELLKRILSGEAAPADINNAIKFLKDNKIEALPQANEAMAKLLTVLPDFDKTEAEFLA